MVFSGQSRFHYPVMPFVCVTAGWLARWLTGLERRANAPVADSAHDFAPAARKKPHDDASRHHHDYHHPGQPGRFRLRA
jgi:hypothetical protein